MKWSLRRLEKPGLNTWAGLKLLWRGITLRHARRAPKTTLVLVLILALGVGTVLAIRLANRSAVAGFALFTESLTGENDLILTPPAGELPVGVLAEIRECLDPIPAGIFPVVETTAVEVRPDSPSNRFDAEQFRLLGLDLIAIQNLVYLDAEVANRWKIQEPTDRSEKEAEETGLWEILGSPHDVFINAAYRRNRGAEPGDRFEVVIDDRRVELVVAGVIPESEFRVSAPPNLLVMDIAGLQRLTGRTNRLSRVEIRLPQGAHFAPYVQTAREQLQQIAAGRWRVETPAARRQSGERMTAAFRLNLTILSTLALLVGIYLIMQAMEAAVSRRRNEIAILRGLGVPGRLIQGAWFAESLTLGIVGSALGVGLGFAGAQFAVRSVAQTVNALYYSTTTRSAAFDWRECAVVFLGGVLAGGIAGWLPARDAALTPPIQVIRHRRQSRLWPLLRSSTTGMALMVAGGLLCFLPPWDVDGGGAVPVAGYLTAFCWLVGAGILAGCFTAPLARCGRKFFREIPVLHYALSHLGRLSDRHRLAMAGLVAAVGMAGGMSVLIHSFESTMLAWIRQILHADLYVSCQGIANASSQNRIPPDTWRALAGDPAVASIDVAALHTIEREGRPVHLWGVRYSSGERGRQMIWIEAPEDPISTLSSGIESSPVPAWVNESFSNHFHRHRGDRIELPTPRGTRAVTIAGVYADYSDEQGSILVPWKVVAEWFGRENASNLAAYLKPAANLQAVRQRWQQAYPELVIRTNATLRAEALKIFRRTFSITQVLKAIGVFVAIAGLALCLVSLMLERREELRVLKELGMTRHQIATAAAGEGLGITVAGLATGLILSLAFGSLLIYVINKQSFGWTLAYRIPFVSLALFAGSVTLIGIAAAYAVGRYGSRLPVEQEE